MITLKNTAAEIQNQMKNAIAKCLKLETKPKVQMVEPNTYFVFGNQNRYVVKMRRGANGQKQIECCCLAADNGQVCYHAAAALAVHTAIVRARLPR